MALEWDFLRGPLDKVAGDLVRTARDCARHRMIVRIGVSSNPLISLIDHKDDKAKTPAEGPSDRLISIYRTWDLDEALAARDLVAKAIRGEQSFPIVVADTEHSILDEDPDLPFFVYLLTDTTFVFPEKDGPLA